VCITTIAFHMEHEKIVSMFTLNPGDIARGLVVAILTGAFLAVVGVVGSANFDVFSADWLLIGKSMVNGAFGAFIGYLLKNFFTASNGKIGGVI